jgi:hypothetical protein
VFLEITETSVISFSGNLNIPQVLRQYKTGSGSGTEHCGSPRALVDKSQG